MTNKAAQVMARLSWAHGTSEARRDAARRNGVMPCAPGKRRGRPRKKRRKSSRHNNVLTVSGGPGETK